MTSSAVDVARRGLRKAQRIVRDQRRIARQPDQVTLRGVELDLTGWASPAIREAIYREWYEDIEADIVAACVRPGDRVLELGCGAGFVTTLTARLAGDGNVFAYEANPAMVEVARRTVARNGVRAEVTNAVLGHGATGTVPFHVHPDFWVSSLTAGEGTTPIEVPALDFDAEAARVGATVLVMDIEGGEVELLNRPVADAVRGICVELHPQVVGDEATSRCLASLLRQGFHLDLGRSQQSVALLRR